MAPHASSAARMPPDAVAEEASASALPSVRETTTRVRRPAGPVSHLEMSELLGPDHEGGIAPAIEPVMPQRTGATGATILNDLVDQIEKGLEKELARAPIEVLRQGYRRVVACAAGQTSGRAIALGPARPAPSPQVDPERRAGE